MIPNSIANNFASAKSVCTAVQAPALVLLCLFTLSACSTVKTPTSSYKKINAPDLMIKKNHPSFRKRIYTGMSMGGSTLKPDTSRTPAFDIKSTDAQASQFRIGMDLHNSFSVEFDTGVLGRANLVQAGTNVSYTSASLSTLIYGFTGVKNRSQRIGFSGYGRVGYSMVQRASAVFPLDYSDSGVLVGLGAEYGFKNGLALRAEATRLATDASVMSVGGIYRFGMSPKQMGKVFVNAARPVLESGDSQVAAGGRVLGGVRESSRSVSNSRGAQTAGQSQALAAKRWEPEASKHDLDGDGVKNSLDQCKDTAPRTTVGAEGCGLFDSVLTDVTFKSASSWLTPKARGVLDNVAVTLLAFPEARIQVRAHTDSDGPADLNLGLSARRAESVVAYFKEIGVSETQLESVGLGESQPIDSNDTSESKRRNRRIELLTLPNVDAIDFTNDTQAGKTQSGKVAGKSSSGKKSVVAKAAKSIGNASEPTFPPMTGVKIEPLPRSEYVSGMTLGGELQGVEFSGGSATLAGNSKNILNDVSRQLHANPTVRLVIMGHTDNQRSPEESKSLSAQRAASVVDYLVSQGIDRARLSAEGFGSSLPVAQNLTDADRRRNERIETRVIKSR